MSKAYKEIKSLAESFGLVMYAYSRRPTIYSVSGRGIYHFGTYSEIKEYLYGIRDGMWIVRNET